MRYRIHSWVLEKIKAENNLKTDFDLEEFLNLSQNTVSKIRRGRVEPQLKTLMKILDAAGVDNIRGALYKVETAKKES